jgi:hypothetical protein
LLVERVNPDDTVVGAPYRIGIEVGRNYLSEAGPPWALGC